MSDRMEVLYVGTDERFVRALRERPVGDVERADPAEDTADRAAEAAVVVVEDDPPDVDGIALARRLRDAGESTPVVVLARDTDGTRHAAALEADVTEYLPGPVSPDLVAERVEGVLDSRARRAADQTAEDVLNRVTDGFFAVDEDWRFTYVNERAEELLERSESEILGSEVWDEFAAAVGTTFQSEYERAMETGDPVTFEEFYPPLSTWFGVRAYPSEDGLSVYFRDISERKRRERELERYETIVETVGDGVYVLDEDSQFVMVNEAYCELSGYDREELLGTHSRDVTGDGPFEQASSLVNRIEADDAESAVMETELETAAGERVPVRATVSRFPFGDDYGRVGVVRDITAEKRYERTLAGLHEATRRLLGDESRDAVAADVLDALVDVIGLPAGAVYLAADDGSLGQVVASPRFEAVGGEPPDASLEPGADSSIRRAYEGGETVASLEDSADVPAESGPGSGLWIPLAGHGVVAVVADDEDAFDADDRRLAELLAASAEAALDRLARDRDRERRRRQLEHLNDVGRELLAAETTEEICRRAVAAAQETLDLPLTTIERYDETDGKLRPIARTDAVSALGDDPLFETDRDPIWEAYANHTSAVYDDVLAATDITAEETPIRSVIIQPLGEHGVLITGSTERGAFTEDDVALAEVLAANTQAVLDRQDRERRLRDRTTSLESKTAELERLNRINDLVRTLTQHLIQASTREEIDQAVVDQLVQGDPYEFVWIGDGTVGSDEISVRAAAGEGGTYLETVSPTLDADRDAPPSARAMAEGAVTVEPSIHASPPMADWRQEGLAAGFGSVIAVPVTYGDTTYGVLTVYAGEREAFTEMERTVLGELGEMIGYAINAVERKKALVSESSIELAFELADPTVPALRFVQETEASFEFEMLLSESDGSFRTFFTIRGVDPDTVLEYATEIQGIEEIEYVSERDGGHFFEAVVAQDGFLGTLVDHGARVREMTADDDGAQVVVALPQGGDINAFIDMFVSTYEGAELVARRERQQQVRTEAQFRRAYRDRLTERQEEVVRTAYLSGFFEWPRESTGEEVAAALGVSQPTVNRHVRNAERALFELVFEDA